MHKEVQAELSVLKMNDPQFVLFELHIFLMSYLF